MPTEFSLSLAAIDLLWEQLRLGTPVRIFEVPSVGATTADRDRLRQIVLDDMASRDLAHRGRVEPEVEEAMVTLSRFQHAIDAVGILDESDLLVKVHRDSTHFNDPVRTAMTDRLETLAPNAKIKDLLEVFERGRVAIVRDGDKFLGLITRTDLLSYLRLNMPKSITPPSREYS